MQDQEIFQLKSQGFSNREIARRLFGDSLYEYKVRRCLKKLLEEVEEKSEVVQKEFKNYWTTHKCDEKESQFVEPEEDFLYHSEEDVYPSASQYEKKIQKLQDTITYLRRENRNHNRSVVYMDSIYSSFIETLKKKAFTPSEFKSRESYNHSKIGVIQLSDIHFGEVVFDTEASEYCNADIAIARIAYHVAKCIDKFEKEGCYNVLLALTGDMINSDRRLDEVTANETSRAEALFLAVDVLQQVIHQILEAGMAASVASVIGNESRINKDVTWTTFTAVDNFDFIIHKSLEMLFKNEEKVFFLTMDDVHEKVVRFWGNTDESNSYNLLLTHGNNTLSGANPNNEIQKLKGRYAEKSIFIDYVIFGHIHQAVISESFARSGSVQSGNGYSTKALNLGGKPSQNCYVVNLDNKSIEATMIDLSGVNLSNYEDYVYPYDKSLLRRSVIQPKEKMRYNRHVN